MLRDCFDMMIALGRGSSTCNRRHSWRNDNRGLRMTFDDGIVHRVAIIRAVRCHRSNIGINLIKQVRYFRDVANVVRRQFHRDDFIRVGIHTKVKFPPPAVRPNTVLLIEPFAFAVDLDTGAVDEDMQWALVHILQGRVECRSHSWS